MPSNPFTSADSSRYEVLSDAEIQSLYPKAAAVPAPAPAARRSAPSIADLDARATELGVDPALARSFFSQESSGNWNSRNSPKGARGGMQVMPGTFKQMMGTDQGQDDPWNNMEAGLRYIRYGMDRLKTSDPALLAAGYHAGYDRPELRRGEIPNTSDGLITTADYARSVAARMGTRFVNTGTRTKADPLAELNKDEPGRYEIVDQPAADPLAELNAQEPGRYEVVPEAEAIKFKTDSTPQDYAPPRERTWGEVGKDTGAQLAEGVNTILGAVPQLVAPDSKVAQFFGDNAKYWQEQQSEPLQQKLAAANKSITAAGEDGVIAQIVEASKVYFSDPALAARFVTTNLPSMVPGIGAAKLAQAAALAKGATAAKAAVAATTAAAGVNAVLNAGGARGDAFDEIKKTLMAQGKSEQEATETALRDSRVVAAIGGIAGAISGKTGLEKAFTHGAAKAGASSAVKAGAKAAAVEMAGEQLEEVAPKVATNVQASAYDNRPVTKDVGRTIVETGIGAGPGAIVSGGMEGVQQRIANQQPAAQVPVVDPEAPVNPVKNTPSTARGPLERATENAANTPDRVTATAPDGSQVQGTVLGTSDDGKVQIVSDDGEVVTMRTGPGGVKIEVEAPNTPLTNALDAAAISHAESPAPEVKAPAEDSQIANSEQAQPEPVAEAPAAEPAAEPVAAPAPAAPLTVAEMDEPALRERLKYIADQARSAGGWNATFIKARREVEKELDARRKAAQPELTPQPAAEEAPAPAALPADLKGAKPRYSYGKKQFELSFANDLDRAAYIAAQDAPSKRDADYLRFATESTGMTEDEVRAHGRKVRDAIKAQAKDASPGTLKVAEVARGAAQPVTEKPTDEQNVSLPAAAEPQAQAPSAQEAAPARADGAEPAAAVSDAGPVGDVQPVEAAGVAEFGKKLRRGKSSASTETVDVPEITPKADPEGWWSYSLPTERTTMLDESAKDKRWGELSGAERATVAAKVNKAFADAGLPTAEPSADPKRQKALERIAAGRAWFNDGVKAKDFITKNGLAETHEVVKGKGGRWDIVAKAPAAPTDVVRSKSGYAEVKLEGKKHFVTPYDDQFVIRDASGIIVRGAHKGPKFNTEAEAIQYAAENAKRKEPANGSDNRTDRQPDGAKAPEQRQEAQPAAEAAAVQPDAAPAEEVAAPKAADDLAGLSRDELEARAEGMGIPFMSRLPDNALAAEIRRIEAKRAKEAPASNRPKMGDVVGVRFESPDRVERMRVMDGPFQHNTYGWAFQVRPADGSAGSVIVPETRLTAAPAANDAPTDPTPPTKPDPFAGNKVFTSDAVAKARARLKSKLGQINSGIDPELLVDGMTIAGAYIESGVRKFSDYAKAMVEDLGENVRPYLLSFYEAARRYPGIDTEGMSSPASALAQHEAMMLADGEKTKPAAKVENQENGNEPAQLDQPGARELAGEQPGAVQGAQPQRQAGRGAEGSGRADARGDDGAGGGRAQQPGGVGDDAGAVSVPAARTDEGRGGQQGRQPVQRGERTAKRDPARDAGNQLDLIPESGTRAHDRADGFVITDEDGIGEGGAKTKFKQNLAAIRLLKELQAAGRRATRAEQQVLAKYVGWGGLPQAFERDGGAVSKGWEKEAAELKAALTPEELAGAAASTRNAHYTSPEIVTGLWDAVKRFGFQGGRTLEPSVGVGNFFGLMPTALRSASQLTGVELDPITGGIAKHLYPNANIQAPVGFQDFATPDGYFDLAIGNPPFGAEGIYDPRNRKISGFSIHNYFFAKSIDAVKPNGVLAMVVTNRLLDKAGDKERQYIAARSEFLGAIRLPNNAFQKNAGTEVTTDIIFLRKLKDGEQPTGAKWMEVKQYRDAEGRLVPLNEYFVANPDMMLGQFGAYGSMYRPDDAALVARPGQDTPALLQAAIAKLPAGFMDAPTAAPALETIEPGHDISSVKVGSVFVQNGQVFERREDMLGKQQAAPVTFPSEKARERVMGMIDVRDALVDVRRLQLQDGVNEKTLEAARARLNKAYDAFVKANGPLNADANKRLMRDDPSWPQIAALEDGFDKGVSATVAKATGEKARPPSARKSAIFFKRTQSPYKAPTKASSAKDALVSSLAERGRVDLDYMASLYPRTPEQIARELDGLIFKNPAGGWESRDQYLSGNVKKKLAQAIEAAKADPSLKANVEALQAVQPADIEAVDIDVKTGAHWVPADVMQTWMTELTEARGAKAVYNPVTANWSLSLERPSAAAATQFSTDRAGLEKVLEAAANQKQITVYDQHYDGTRTLNEAATTAANEKVEKVKAEWKKWLWQDDARRTRLARIYNDTFNTDVQRQFDGSHLTFPGKVGDDIFNLRPHQKNGVWRMVQSGTTLLDHTVGAGKTATVITGAMEMRRMGLAKKPMIVVPNHLVGQWAADFMKLYPGANILAASKKDFEKGARQKLFARIATGDWDAVIVAHSSFGKVEVEPEFQAEFIKQQIVDMNTSIEAMRAAEGKSSRNVKQIEKQKANLEEKLKRLFDTGNKDDNLYFGELGVDALMVDECFSYDTIVETDAGPLKIGDIVRDKLRVNVKSRNSSTHAVEWKPVVNWYANTRRGLLMEVFHESGSFICTPNHKVWIAGHGYKLAADIGPGDSILAIRGAYSEAHEGAPRYSAVRVVRDSGFVPSEQAPEVLQRVLQDARAARRPRLAGQVEGGHAGNVAELAAQGAQQPVECRAHDAEQPHGIAGDARQGFAVAQGHRAPASEARWQRHADGAAAPASVAAAADAGAGHQDGDHQAPDVRPAALLQGGPGLPGVEAGGGTGRRLASLGEGQGGGCQEGAGLVASRVVAVAVLERDGDGEYRFCGREHSAVYDIEVADNHNYFANGALVSNCHEFKNLGFSTGMQRVAGLGNPTGSNKAADMFMKIQATLARTGGRNVVFATGTPISNTMAEMYTMQRYLDYGTLKDQGISHFDAWAKTFGEVVTDWELSPSGQYKMNSRFAKFVNMPELMQRYSSFADVINRDDINRMLASQGKKLPVPKVATGKPENTVVPRSDAQAVYIGMPTIDDNGVESYPKGSLIWRSENLPKKAEKGADNMLKIMSDARKAALDMRLIDPSYPDNPGSKVNVAAGNIKAIYDQWAPQKGTQLVFIDLSTPKAAVAKEAAALRELVSLAEQGDEAAQEKLDAMSPDELLALDAQFSVYDDLKAKLIAQGIPENEIAFIHDANTEIQKEDLFGKVRSGRVRVLFGSTAKMGAGMNVQERLVALHHLDAPWRPSDLEQREGRIIRQGNALYDADPEGFEVRILRYATKQTLDSRMWQTIEAKARFIEQVRKGTGERQVEDVASEAANAAEMKAASSGNPLILEEMSLRQAIRKLENQQAEHDREQYRIRDSIRWSESRAEAKDRSAAEMATDATLAPAEFAVTIGNQTFDKHGEAGEAILDAVKVMHEAGVESREIGSYGGFKLVIDDASAGRAGKDAVLTLEGKAGTYQTPASPGSSAVGLGLRLQNTVKNLAADAKAAEKEAARMRAEVPKLQAQIKPWGGAEELAADKARHAAIIEQLKPKKKEQAKPAEAGEKLSIDAGEAPPDTQTYGPATQPHRDAVRELRDTLESKRKPGERAGTVWDAVTPPAGPAGSTARSVAQIARRLFNREVVYVKFDGPAVFNGAVSRKHPGKIFLNVQARRPLMAVLGHELLHEMAKSSPGVYAKLSTALDGLIKNESTYVADVKKRYSAQGLPINEFDIREELEADIVGDNFMDAGFWAEVSKEQPSLFKRIADQVMKWLDSVVRKLGAQRPFGTEQFLADIEAARAAVAQAVREFSGTEVGAVAGEDRLSVAGKTPQTETEEFKRWFGDSKVVDAQGKPLVVYHGTSSDFTQFATSWGGNFGEGFYFGDADTASRYGEADGRRVMPVYLSLQNPATQGIVDPLRDRADAGEIDYDEIRADLERRGYDGIAADGMFVAFRPEQIKSATGNRGTFDPSNPDIRLSVADTPPGLTPPPQGFLRRVQAAVQDNLNRVKQVQEQIEKITGRKPPEYADYYGAETNRPGRIAARLEDARDKLTGPLMEKLAKSGFTAEQLGELLHAQHAQERNEAIAKINPDMPDGGSGMTNDEADAILAKYKDARDLQRLAADARAIARQTLDLKLAYGLIDEEAYEALTNAYENYVPLKGDGEFGPKIKRAMGHEGREEFILENIARDYDQAVVVGERNLARQSLLQMVLQNPDPALWTVGLPPKGRYVAGRAFDVYKGEEKVATFDSQSQAQAWVEGRTDGGAHYQIAIDRRKFEVTRDGKVIATFDKHSKAEEFIEQAKEPVGKLKISDKGETVREFVKPLQDNEVMVYVDGRPVRIQIKDETLARQLRPLDQGRLNPILEAMRTFNRYLSSIFTGKNPTFIFTNLMRDLQTGTINMLGNQGAATAAKAWANYPAATKALAAFATSKNAPDTPMGQFLREYRDNGGKTGASWMADLEQQGKSLQRMYEDAFGATNYLKDGKPGKAALVAGRKALSNMAHVVEVANQVAENSLRLALFAALRQQGVSASRAAQAAKTVSVDFDKKGTMTPMLGALYLFINPAVQGTANAIKTIAKGEHRQQAWAALGTLVALGMWAAAQGLDDDEDKWLGEGWDSRSKKLVLRIGGHRIVVPLSQEYAPLYAAGVALEEARRGASTSMQSAVRFVSSMLDAYFPARGAFNPDSDNHALDAAMSATPTAIRSLMLEPAVNRNSFGSKIVPETEFTKDKPDNLKLNRNTKGTPFDDVAQGIAAAGEALGAGKFDNDLSKVSPETLRHFWRNLTGGLGTFVTDTVGATKIAAGGGSLEMADVPIVKSFASEDNVKPLRSRYFDLAKEAKQAAAEFGMAKKAADGEAMDAILDDPKKAAVLGLTRLIQRTNAATAELRDMAVEINADATLSVADKRAKLKELEKQEEEILRAALEAFKQP